ncbi:MAG TPA: hypothetical protein VGV93_10805 [Acidimicrobiales bacterium]|nr:hypothetical protein [Acidimicrobiales bacterium]
MTDTGSEESEWYRSLDLDRYAIEVRFVEDPTGQNVREVWDAELLDVRRSMEVPFDLIGQLVAGLRVEGGPPVPHVATHRQTYLSWGADAAAAQIILEVAADALPGVAAAAVYDGLKHVVRRLVSQAQARSDEPQQPLSRNEAIEQARSHLVGAFGLAYEEAEQLELVGEEISGDGSRLFRFRLDDRRFEAELVDEYGLVRIGRLGWTDAQP